MRPAQFRALVSRQVALLAKIFKERFATATPWRRNRIRVALMPVEAFPFWGI